MFNQHGRTENVVKTSLVGTICKFINIILGFVYRTIFIHILSASYLGINGLFSNILQILSFAELGISSAIVFRFYEPISRNDSYKVGQLMNFFKSVYRIIALIIFIAGMLLLPFLKFFIRDTSELPPDINLQLIYLLFLFQTISSYLFVYKQTILNADQRQYISNLVETVTTLIRYILQLGILILTKNYTLTLCVNISFNLLSNLIFSEWVSHQYKSVFDVKENISKTEKEQILDDTKATLCHKIGGTVLTSTDNIILSKWVGLIATGVYSNYSMVISNMSVILVQLFGSFTSSLGNEHVEHDEKQVYTNYRRLLFANLWLTSVCTVCLYNLLNDFIVVWVGPEMLLDELTLVVLCIQFFVENARIISLSYTNGCGLFVRDKIRPVIEASINIVVSIVLAKMMGIAGVFIGTIVSHVCTVFWREPYLLYKYEFKRGMKEYWIYYVSAFLITILVSFLVKEVDAKLLIFQINNILIWTFKALSIFIFCNLILIVLLHRNSDFLFYYNLIKGRLKRNGRKK